MNGNKFEKQAGEFSSNILIVYFLTEKFNSNTETVLNRTFSLIVLHSLTHSLTLNNYFDNYLTVAKHIIATVIIIPGNAPKHLPVAARKSVNQLIPVTVHVEIVDVIR
jgi:hypothetical protein